MNATFPMKQKHRSSAVIDETRLRFALIVFKETTKRLRIAVDSHNSDTMSLRELAELFDREYLRDWLSNGFRTYGYHFIFRYWGAAVHRQMSMLHLQDETNVLHTWFYPAGIRDIPVPSAIVRMVAETHSVDGTGYGEIEKQYKEAIIRLNKMFSSITNMRLFRLGGGDAVQKAIRTITAIQESAQHGLTIGDKQSVDMNVRLLYAERLSCVDIASLDGYNGLPVDFQRFVVQFFECGESHAERLKTY